MTSTERHLLQKPKNLIHKKESVIVPTSLSNQLPFPSFSTLLSAFILLNYS